jgi:hypothetical protein
MAEPGIGFGMGWLASWATAEREMHPHAARERVRNKAGIAALIQGPDFL